MADMAVENPGDIDIVLTKSWPLNTWLQLSKQLGGHAASWPASDLASEIMDMSRQVKKHFYPKERNNAYFSI
jgi:hypothetical protein